jgi:hypothetical protein
MNGMTGIERYLKVRPGFEVVVGIAYAADTFPLQNQKAFLFFGMHFFGQV